MDKSLTTRALGAVFLAAVGNAFLYFVCYVAGVIPWNMLSPGRGVSITPKLVALVSAGGAVGGAALYAVLRKTSSNPDQRFRVYAGTLLVLSFAAPLMIETFSTALTIALDLMHIVVYASTVYALTIWRSKEAVTASA